MVYHTTRVKPEHTLVPLLAQAVEAAASQGKFHEMYHAVFQAQADLPDRDPTTAEKQVTKIAGKAGLDVIRFQADLHGDATRQAFQKDEALARSLNVSETPTFFFLTPSRQNKRFYTTGGMLDYLKDPANWK